MRDSWIYQNETDETPPQRFQSQPSLSRLANLNSQIETEQQQLSQTVANHRLDRDDPLFEVLEVVGGLKRTVDNLNHHIPNLMGDVMINQAQNIEQRVILAVRQHQLGEAVIDLNPIVEIVDRAAQTSNNQLIQQTERLSQIALKPQKIPFLFYGIVGSFGLLSLFASAFTWKTVNERVGLANWVNTPDGKLARQIVLANKNGLNKQCQESTRKLNAPVVVNGIGRDKLCFVAIP